jgi:hypothetical protein
MRRGRSGVLLGLLIATSGVVACSIAIRRDLSAVPPGQVGFDDMCDLQEYFDALEIKSSPPPRVVTALDIEEGGGKGKATRGGRERFAFENDFQLKHLRRVLEQNWRRIPEQVDRASKIEVEVKWSEKAGAKRVITDEPAELSVGIESWDIPYHVCLSELLYGEPLYRQRRLMWGLPLPGGGAAAAKQPLDGGAGEVVQDAGASPDASRDASSDGKRSDGKQSRDK